MRLAGQGGEVMFLVDVADAAHAAGYRRPDVARWDEYVDAYLEPYVQEARSHGVRAATHKLWISDPIPLVTEMAGILKADVIACSTHGRTPFGRLVRGATAWHIVAHSAVPVLLRHIEGDRPPPQPLGRKHIAVPLDGSAYAEKALPLAAKLATEWGASLSLVRVPTIGFREWGAANLAGWSSQPVAHADAVAEAGIYLEAVAGALPVPAQTHVLEGSPIAATLADFVQTHAVTSVVMTTHGRTGLSRVVIGSVADALVHQLTCAMILVPALAAARVTPRSTEVEDAFRVPVEAG
jgi:nucleotide-binding universal stress UspA family protein